MSGRSPIWYKVWVTTEYKDIIILVTHPLDFPFPKILLIRDIILTFGLVCFDFEFLDAVHSIQLLAYTCFNSPY